MHQPILHSQATVFVEKEYITYANENVIPNNNTPPGVIFKQCYCDITHYYYYRCLRANLLLGMRFEADFIIRNNYYKLIRNGKLLLFCAGKHFMAKKFPLFTRKASILIRHYS